MVLNRSDVVRRYLMMLIMVILTFACEAEQSGYESLTHSEDWEPVFVDDCTQDWTEKWFLDGLQATVENTREGMHVSAGPEAGNDAHHAVLWTKESFKGEIKIEYDYIRTDSANRYVTILYIQAAGDQEGNFVEDITQWNGFREVPAMRKYFNNMNLLHISYAAFGNEGDGFYYVRARRYPKPNDQGFKVTQIEPSYDYQGFFETDRRYHITAIKSEDSLYFHVESEEGEELFTWDLSHVEPIKEGRIGLRHMYTRSAVYQNVKIYTRD